MAAGRRPSTEEIALLDTTELPAGATLRLPCGIVTSIQSTYENACGSWVGRVIDTAYLTIALTSESAFALFFWHPTAEATGTLAAGFAGADATAVADMSTIEATAVTLAVGDSAYSIAAGGPPQDSMRALLSALSGYEIVMGSSGRPVTTRHGKVYFAPVHTSDRPHGCTAQTIYALNLATMLPAVVVASSSAWLGLHDFAVQNGWGEAVGDGIGLPSAFIGQLLLYLLTANKRFSSSANTWLAIAQEVLAYPEDYGPEFYAMIVGAISRAARFYFAAESLGSYFDFDNTINRIFSGYVGLGGGIMNIQTAGLGELEARMVEYAGGNAAITNILHAAEEESGTKATKTDRQKAVVMLAAHRLSSDRATRTPGDRWLLCCTRTASGAGHSIIIRPFRDIGTWAHRLSDAYAIGDVPEFFGHLTAGSFAGLFVLSRVVLTAGLVEDMVNTTVGRPVPGLAEAASIVAVASTPAVTQLARDFLYEQAESLFTLTYSRCCLRRPNTPTPPTSINAYPEDDPEDIGDRARHGEASVAITVDPTGGGRPAIPFATALEQAIEATEPLPARPSPCTALFDVLCLRPTWTKPGEEPEPGFWSWLCCHPSSTNDS